LPALLSQHAPAGSKGSASGIYTTFQFFGAFLGGVVGGLLTAWSGQIAVMIFCMGLLVCWLLFTIGMHSTVPTTRITLTLPLLDEQSATDVAEQLVTQQGVEEVVVVREERTAYLKINQKTYKAEAVKALLAAYQ